MEDHKAMEDPPEVRILTSLSGEGHRPPVVSGALLSNLNPSIWETYYV